MTNPFFKKYGPFTIKDILELCNIKNFKDYPQIEVINVSDLITAEKNEVTFFHSKRYEILAKNTKASFCVTTKNLSRLLPKSCYPIIVENVLINTAKITKLFYPDSVDDNFDDSVKNIEKTSFTQNI